MSKLSFQESQTSTQAFLGVFRNGVLVGKILFKENLKGWIYQEGIWPHPYMRRVFSTRQEAQNFVRFHQPSISPQMSSWKKPDNAIITFSPLTDNWSRVKKIGFFA